MADHSDPLTLVWRGDPTDLDESEVPAALEVLAAEYSLTPGNRRTVSTTYVDTVDGRLRSRGLTLSHERTNGAGELVLVGEREVARTPLTEPQHWPARIEQLAEGTVRDAVATALWIRAAVPVLRSKSTTRSIAVRNSDDKIVVRLEWTAAEGVEPPTKPIVRVTVRPILGYQSDAAAVGKALLTTEAFGKAKNSLYEALTRAVGVSIERSTGDVMAADTRADVAVATALLGFTDAITSNVDGTVKDIDSEFLHDLRVAVRRTRSMLKLAGDVLPGDIAARYEPEFRWLGDLTTPTRDLDVYLLELDDLAHHLTVGEPTDLDAFGEHLRTVRVIERRKLARGLGSPRFTEFMNSWRADLVAIADGSATSTHELTAAALAADRISRTYKRVVKKAQAITPESESEEVHALRKRCKELRYLLEVFGPVCEPTAHRGAVKDLKQLQDLLGKFQDGEMQSAGLRVFAQEMLEAERPPAATLLAMGELSAAFGRQQREAREALNDQLHRYLGPHAHKRIEALLP